MALITPTIFTANIQSVSAASAGSAAGKAQGRSDAINGRPSDASCGSGHSNSYCFDYKI